MDGGVISDKGDSGLGSEPNTCSVKEGYMGTVTYVTPHNGRVYGDAMRTSDPTVPVDQGVSTRELVAGVGTVMNRRLTEITQDLLERLCLEVSEIAGDNRLAQLMATSIEANVDTIVHMLRHGIDVERTVAPSAAIEYARRVAQRGLPVNTLVRCYRLGQESFLRWCLEELQRQSDDATAVSTAALRIVADASAYIDRVSQQVVVIYEEERERWLVNRSAARSARVAELLDGRAVDIDSAENTLAVRRAATAGTRAGCVSLARPRGAGAERRSRSTGRGRTRFVTVK